MLALLSMNCNGSFGRQTGLVGELFHHEFSYCKLARAIGQRAKSQYAIQPLTLFLASNFSRHFSGLDKCVQPARTVSAPLKSIKEVFLQCPWRAFLHLILIR